MGGGGSSGGSSGGGGGSSSTAKGPQTKSETCDRRTNIHFQASQGSSCSAPTWLPEKQRNTWLSASGFPQTITPSSQTYQPAAFEVGFTTSSLPAAVKEYIKPATISAFMKLDMLTQAI